jgi:hypothetical protein
MAKTNPKFTSRDNAYILQFYSLVPRNDILYKVNIKLIEIIITSVDKKGVHGFHFERYGYIMEYYPHMESKIHTKKNKYKGKEIPWKENDTVAIMNTYAVRDLLTLDEAKMRMIQFIANDFNDEESVCIGCTHGQDESY